MPTLAVTIIAWITAAWLVYGGLRLIWRGVWGDRSRGRRRCPKCWYEVAGLESGRCPECGRDWKSEAELLRTRRHVRPVLLGAAALVLAGVAPRLPYALRDPWQVLPTPVLLIALQFYDAAGDDIYARTAGLAQGGARLSRWERVLLARACGRRIVDRARFLESAAAPTRAGGRPPAVSVWGLRGDAVVQQAAYVLTTLGTAAHAAVPDLRALQRSRHAGTRRFAAETLGQIGPVSLDVAPALGTALQDPELEVVKTAVVGLSGFPAEEPVPIDRLVKLLAHEDMWEVHHAIARLLERRGARASSAADALETAARSAPAAHARYAAARAVARVEPEARARQRLTRLLQSDDYDTRLGAARALKLTGAGGAELMLVAQATRDGKGRLGVMGVEALRSFGEPAVPALIELAADPEMEVAEPAIYALGSMRAGGATDVLVAALAHPEQRMRFAAMKALERIGPAAAAAAPALERVRDASTGEGASRAEAALHAVRAAGAPGRAGASR